MTKNLFVLKAILKKFLWLKMWETNNLLSAYSRQITEKLFKTRGNGSHYSHKQHFPSIETFTSLINLILVHSKHFFNSPNFTQEFRTRNLTCLSQSEISLKRNSPLTTVSNGLNFLYKSSKLKMNRCFLIWKAYPDHRSSISAKSVWCKSAWKLTTQSLHVCKNRSI